MQSKILNVGFSVWSCGSLLYFEATESDMKPQIIDTTTEPFGWFPSLQWAHWPLSTEVYLRLVGALIHNKHPSLKVLIILILTNTLLVSVDMWHFLFLFEVFAHCVNNFKHLTGRLISLFFFLKKWHFRHTSTQNQMHSSWTSSRLHHLTAKRISRHK